MYALDNLLLSNDLLSCKNNKSANLRIIAKNCILTMLITILAINLVSCNKLAKQAVPVYIGDTICTDPEYTLVIHLQPLGSFSQSKAEQLKRNLEQHLSPIYPCTIQVDPNIDLPKSAYYKPRNRYWAGGILKYLKQQSDEVVVIGLTDKDISTSIHGQFNYGIMGLSYKPGNSCIVSTYRLKRRDDLWKVTMHEFLHSRGLPHCLDDNSSCIMQDAHGHNTFYRKFTICKRCKSFLTRVG